MFCPECGASNPSLTSRCLKCGASLPLSPPPVAGRPDAPTAHTSNTGAASQVPPEIRYWNWGGFFLGWIWGIGNSVWISLLGLVPVVNIVMAFILGAKGNEWAWTARRWDSVEHFKRVQRKWTVAGFIICIIGVIIWVTYFTMATCAIMNSEETP